MWRKAESGWCVCACVYALLSMRELWKYELVNFECGAVLVVVKREDPQKALKWPTKSVATLFLLRSIPVFPLFSGSRSSFSLSNYFYRSTSLFIYLIPPSVSLVQFPLQFFLLILSSMEEVCHDKDQKLKGRGKKRRMPKTLRKKNNPNGEREESRALKRVDNKNNARDTRLHRFSLELHAFWWSRWKWDPDPNERGTGNERR